MLLNETCLDILGCKHTVDSFNVRGMTILVFLREKKYKFIISMWTLVCRVCNLNLLTLEFSVQLSYKTKSYTHYNDSNINTITVKSFKDLLLLNICTGWKNATCVDMLIKALSWLAKRTRCNSNCINVIRNCVYQLSHCLCNVDCWQIVSFL